MPQDITLPQPVRLQLGGGLTADGQRKPVQVVMLGAGLNRNVPDEVANHPFIKQQLKSTPRPVDRQTFSSEQLQLLDRLGLSPQQRQLLEQLQAPQPVQQPPDALKQTQVDLNKDDIKTADKDDGKTADKDDGKDDKSGRKK